MSAVDLRYARALAGLALVAIVLLAALACVAPRPRAGCVTLHDWLAGTRPRSGWGELHGFLGALHDAEQDALGAADAPMADLFGGLRAAVLAGDVGEAGVLAALVDEACGWT